MKHSSTTCHRVMNYIIPVIMLVFLTGVQNTTGELKGRLPNNYGKLGLSDVQKQKIYTVQAKYKTKIDELEKQLDELKEKHNKEVAGVLTPAQAKLLHELEIGGNKTPDTKSKK